MTIWRKAVSVQLNRMVLSMSFPVDLLHSMTNNFLKVYRRCDCINKTNLINVETLAQLYS